MAPKKSTPGFAGFDIEGIQEISFDEGKLAAELVRLYILLLILRKL